MRILSACPTKGRAPVLSARYMPGGDLESIVQKLDRDEDLHASCAYVVWLSDLQASLEIRDFAVLDDADDFFIKLCDSCAATMLTNRDCQEIRYHERY